VLARRFSGRHSAPVARPRTSTKRSKKPRVRRDAETARAAILEATEKRLVHVGPSGIRLQEVAADAGVSHPTVLHHFGSREALVQAVIVRAFQALNADMVNAIRDGIDSKHLAGMFESVFQVLSKGGHARVLMWLALEGVPAQKHEGRLEDVVVAAQALRTAQREASGRPAPSVEDTANMIVLAALALAGSAVLGPALFEDAGLTRPDAGERFRAWLAEFLLKPFQE
jgi:AcrR family transcriptional regulator